MQACTWNVKGKSIQQVVDWLTFTHYPEIIALQEVGGVHLLHGSDAPSRGESGNNSCQLKELAFDLHSDLHDYRVFAASTEAHLSQVIAIDKVIVDHVLHSFVGRRVIGVLFKHAQTQHHTAVLCVHLPHSGYSDTVFQEAVHEVTDFMQQHSQYDIIACGDWNSEPGDCRYDLLSVPLILQGRVSCPQLNPQDLVFVVGSWIISLSPDHGFANLPITFSPRQKTAFRWRLTQQWSRALIMHAYCGTSP